MARMVRREATGPIKIEAAPGTLGPDGAPPKPIWICACGLSQTFPFCDGTHKACRAAEQPGILYVYDRDNKTVVEERPDPNPPPPPAPPPPPPAPPAP